VGTFCLLFNECASYDQCQLSTILRIPAETPVPLTAVYCCHLLGDLHNYSVPLPCKPYLRIFWYFTQDRLFVLNRGADKSLARPGRKQANVSVRMACISFGALPCRKKKIDDSSRLDVVEIARVPDMLPRLFTSWSG